MNKSCGEPTLLRLSDLHPDCIKLGVDVFGYLAPILALLVTVMNVLIIIVFMRPHIRSHTTFILTLIACADTLDIVCPAGIFAYIYLFGHYKEYLRCSQLEWAYILGEICVDMFNMLSLWLTVLLAFMRCRCIKSPFVAKQAHSFKRTLVYLISILTLVISLHVPSFFIFDFRPVQYVDKEKNETMIICAMQESNGKFLKTCSERKMQLVMETLLDSILPCVLLVYFNCAMLFTLKRANESRSSLRCNSSVRQYLNKDIKEDDVRENDVREDDVREDDAKDEQVKQTTASCNDTVNVNFDRSSYTILNIDPVKLNSDRNCDAALNGDTVTGNSDRTGDTTITNDSVNVKSYKLGDTTLNDAIFNVHCNNSGYTNLINSRVSVRSNTILNYDIVNIHSYRTDFTTDLNDDIVDVSSDTIDLDVENTDCHKDAALRNLKVNQSDIIRQDNDSKSDAVLLGLKENNKDKKTALMNFKLMCKCFTCQRSVKKNDRNRTSSDSTIDKLDRESRRTSWLILCVSSIIVIHEVPLVVLNIYNLTTYRDKPLPLSNGCFSIVLLLWQFVTYPAIFLIYACMSGAFRLELLKTFTCQAKLNKSRLSKDRKSFVCPCSVRKSIIRKEAKRANSRDCI